VAEVERRLSALPGIKDFHVDLRRTGTGEARMMAWVQQEMGAERTTTDLRVAVGDATAGFHGLLLIIDVGRLPRRNDNSIAAGRLEDPFADLHAAGFEFPRAGAEVALAEIWSEILAVERIGAHDSFAELGGNSLQALRVIQRMEARLGWRVEPRLLFFQSLRQVAARAPVHAESQAQAA
jgi:acyl carrier protein